MLFAVLTLGLAASCPRAAADLARSRYQAVEYSGALSAVSHVEECTDGTAEELAEALRWRAQALAASQKTEPAIEAFALAITISPLYVLDPLVAPKVHSLFNQARARVRDQKRVYARAVARSGRELTLEVFDPRRKVRAVTVIAEGERLNAGWRGDLTWVANSVPPSAQAVTLEIEQGDAPLVTLTDRPLPAAAPDLVPAAKMEAAPTPVEAAVASSPATKGPNLPMIVGLSAGAAAVVIAVAIGVGVASSGGKLNGTLGRVEIPPSDP